jgi:methionine sulfoxide reductase heme-binding subunit
VTIGLAASVIPFASPYKPLWIGLGAVALDIMVALILTSLARARIGRSAWRAVHWLAYASWPVAVAHGLGSSNDLRSGWLLLLTVICIAAVAGAACLRIAAAIMAPPAARRAATVLADAEQHGPRELTGAGAR